MPTSSANRPSRRSSRRAARQSLSNRQQGRGTARWTPPDKSRKVAPPPRTPHSDQDRRGRSPRSDRRRAVGKLYTILFKVPELQRKILMTAMFLAIYRIGFYVPLPIVNQGQLQSWQETQSRNTAG